MPIEKRDLRRDPRSRCELSVHKSFTQNGARFCGGIYYFLCKLGLPVEREKSRVPPALMKLSRLELSSSWIAPSTIRLVDRDNKRLGMSGAHVRKFEY